MKTNHFLIVLFLVCQFCYAQQVPVDIQWSKVDSLELKGQITTALELVDQIKNTSDKNQDVNYVKASIYRWKFLKQTTEEAEDAIILEIDKEIASANDRNKAIYNTIKARLLKEYFEENNYRNTKRSSGTQKGAKLSTWSPTEVVQEATKSYQQALSKKDVLIDIPVAEVEEILQTSIAMRLYKPTLFDVIAQEALEFYSSYKYGIARPETLFEIDNSIIFSDSEAFQDWDFKSKDTLVSSFQSVKLLQDIERLHKDNADNAAFVYAQMARLKFAKNKYVKDANELYGESLMALSRKHKNDNINGLLSYELANYHADSAPKGVVKDSTEVSLSYYAKAQKICSAIIEEYPNSEAATRSNLLLKEINSKTLDIKTKSHVLPNQKNRLFVKYRNLDSLRVRIFKLPVNDSLFKSNKLFNSFWNMLSDEKKKPANLVYDKSVSLPQSEDLNYHSIELLLPALSSGYYFIYTDNSELEKNKEYAYAQIEVSNLGFKKTEYDAKMVYQFYDRATGQPLENISIKTESPKSKYSTAGKTNEYGEYELYKIKRNSNYNSNQVTIRAIRNRDTLLFQDYLYRYYQDEESEEAIVQTQLYLDRGIYRPGQKLYFKGIVLKDQNKSKKVVSNQTITVYIDDANYKEIYEKEFTTNEFGSFSGEFILPKEVLTGEFQIYLEEGDEEFWDDIDDFREGTTSFNVEEYKRPTFEITFDEVQKAHKPNDSISITGNAKAFLGSNITDSKGSYTITRETYDPHRYYFGYNNGVQIDEGEFETDDNGNFNIEFIALFENEKEDKIYEYKIAAKITDVNGETRENSITIKIAKNNLYSTVKVPDQTKSGDKIQINVTNKNLNDVLVSCANDIRLYKLQSPEKIQFDRLWPSPQFQTIDSKDFEEAFPQEPHYEEKDSKKRGKLIYEAQFLDSKTIEAILEINQNWISGTYEIEHTAKDNNGNSTVTTREIYIEQSTDPYLQPSELFKHKITNKHLRKDGFVDIELQTSLNNLPVLIKAFDKQKRVHVNKVVVDGKRKVRVPVISSIEDGFTIRLQYAHFDRFFSEDLFIDLSEPIEFLKVETETFRNKLNPDSKEKWSFKIVNQDDKKVQAEVLASMYDSSLDTFAESYWNPDLTTYRYDYMQIPSFSNQKKYVTNFINRISRVTRSRYQSRFDRFNFYGLSFKGTYEYNQYLRSLKRRLENPITKNSNVGNIIGVVLEENGPLPGASVLIKGTTTGTQTDFDGQYSIDASPDDILVISYVGYETVEVPVGGNILYTTLAPSEDLDEVIVTAQGIKREKKALGYAVAEVRSEELSEEIVVASALNGKASGVQVASAPELNSGLPVQEPQGYGSRESLNVKRKYNFKNVKVRRNLQETAFFFPHLTTDKKGRTKFSFDAPQLLTRWKFRLLGHTKGAISGGLEKAVITQKDLSIVPNTPRFLREGDIVFLSAKIANLTNKQLKGAAQLQLFDAFTMQPIDVALQNDNETQDIAINPQGNTSVFWQLQIPEGLGAIAYRMVAKAGNFSDGEENVLPVLSNRMLVTETVPFLVRSGEEKEVTLNKLLTNDSPTLKNESFTLEYTYNPSWYALQSLPYLMEFPHECAEQTFSRYYANALSAKVLASNPKIKKVFEQWKGDGVLQSALEKNEELKNILIAETPWLRNANSETERKKRLGLLFDLEANATAQNKALDKLKDLQNSDGGFPWFSGGESNVYITRHIVAGFGHLDKLGIPLGSSKMLEDAIDYLDIQLEGDFEKYLKEGGEKEDFYGRTSIIHFLYARSFFAKAFPMPFKVRQITDPALEVQNNYWFERSVYEKGLLALVNHRYNKPQEAIKILTALKESAVNSKIIGMYWKENTSGWYWYQAPIETQSLLIEAFDEVLQDDKTIEELKIWLLQQKRTSDWGTTKATADATYALLMVGTNFIDLKDDTSIVMASGFQEKLENAPKEAGTGHLKVSWHKDEITNDIAKVQIASKGKTTGYGGLYWQYFEDLDKIKSSEKQVLNLSKKLFLVNYKDTTAPLQEINSSTALSLGQTIRVQLVINTLSDMEFVHLNDLRASGLEPIDVLSKHTYQDGLWYYQSTKDVATHFFFDRLPQGTYVIEYDLRVNNKGSFSNGISTIQSMYAPEYSGNTAGLRIQIN